MNNKEIRYTTTPVQYRAADGTASREIVGVAAMVGTRATIGWFDEEISPGAFDGVLGNDVRCLGNHDANIVFGRTAAGTLQLSLDANGHLVYRCQMPETTTGNDWLELIKRGDISQSSFAFAIEDETWIERTGQNPLRIINRFAQLYDVSPVTYPAYPTTEVAARSMAAALNHKHNARVGAARAWVELYK